jgi:hypothetical protein
MSLDIKELRVGYQENAKRVMYFAKQLLLNTDEIDLVSGTNGAPVSARACQELVRLQYATYTDIRTETNVVEGFRKVKMVIRLTKTLQFQKLFDENEEIRKQKQAERESKQTDKPSDTKN